MWCETRMKLALLVLLLYLVGVQSKSVKRNQNELSTPSETDDDFERTPKPKLIKAKRPLTKLSSPAIIAIEIVDPNDNTTKSKNSKRTIESSLGYGYQPNYFGATNSPQKFQVYKYSQRDILPYRGRTEYNHGTGNAHYSIQKSLTYDLGSTRPEVVYDNPVQYVQPSLNQYYQPGTILYSTLNQQGHLGGLTSQVPHAQGAVPVIFVRILSNQLSNAGALYPNIPKSNPYAASLNSIDLQSLLTNHLSNILNQYDYSSYNQQPATQNYQQYQYQQYDHPADDLPTHENYPDDAHTRVIFHSNKGKQSRTYLPVPQSYINMAFSPPKEQYDYASQNSQDSPTEQDVYPNHGGEQQNPQYVFVPTPAQNDDQSQGYYYPSTTQQDYYSGEVPNQQVAGDQENYEVTPENLIDTQTVPAQPYNYHAHRTTRSKSRKRNVPRRPAVVKKITVESSK